MSIKQEMEDYLNKNPSLIQDLIIGFKNSKEKTFSIKDGNLRFILLYSNTEKTLKLYGNIGFYSCLIFSCEYQRINNNIKEGLIKVLK